MGTPLPHTIGCADLQMGRSFHSLGPSGATTFSGDRDVVAFLRLVQSLNMIVLLRPGPYICAEWDFGGVGESMRVLLQFGSIVVAVARVAVEHDRSGHSHRQRALLDCCGALVGDADAYE